MNKRINELARQASEAWYGGEFFDRQKFAELIVQECISVVSRRAVGDHNREDAEVARCVADIKKHFGVEDDQTDT